MPSIIQTSFLDGKLCTKCKVWKPSSSFNPRPDNGKLRPWCVECNRRYKQAHRDQHRDIYSNTRNAYYSANKQTIRKQQKSAYDADPQKRKRAYERTRQWQKDNPVRHRAARKVIDSNRRVSNGRSNYVYQNWLAMCDWFSGVCLCCGSGDPLTIDHVIPITHEGQNTIENVQPLCLHCNTSKGAYHETDYRDPTQLALFLASIGH